MMTGLRWYVVIILLLTGATLALPSLLESKAANEVSVMVIDSIQADPLTVQIIGVVMIILVTVIGLKMMSGGGHH